MRGVDDSDEQPKNVGCERRGAKEEGEFGTGGNEYVDGKYVVRF